MVHARPQFGSITGHPLSGSPNPPSENAKYELWIRRGQAPWRSEGTGSRDALRLRGVKEVEGLEKRGTTGEIYIGLVGDFPEQATKGNYSKTDGGA